MIRKVYLKSMGIIISAAHLIWLIRNYYDGTSDIKIEEKSNFQIIVSIVLNLPQTFYSLRISCYSYPLHFTSNSIQVLSTTKRTGVAGERTH